MAAFHAEVVAELDEVDVFFDPWQEAVEAGEVDLDEFVEQVGSTADRVIPTTCTDSGHHVLIAAY